MPATYYVRRRGSVHGPFTKQQIQDGIKAKKLDPAADEYSTTQTGPWQAVYAIEYEADQSTLNQVSSALSSSAYVARIRNNSAYAGARNAINVFATLAFLGVGLGACFLLVLLGGTKIGAWIAVLALAVLAGGAIHLSQAAFVAFFDGVDTVIDIGRKSVD